MRIIGDNRQYGGSIRTRSNSSRRSCSAMVTFESIKPTQIWQASASPSPPIATTGRRGKIKRPVDSLALSMIAQTSAKNNHWLSLSTGDEEDLSDSTDEEVEKGGSKEKRKRSNEIGKRSYTSNSYHFRTSPSSSDSSSSSFEISRSSNKSSRHRRKMQSSIHRHRCETTGGFSSESSSTSSDSSSTTSSSSSSEEDGEFDLCWRLKAGGSLKTSAHIQSTPQLKRTSYQPNHVISLPTPNRTPQLMPRYSSVQQRYNRPQTLNLTNSAFPRPMSTGSSSKDPNFVQTFARAIEDFFPTLEWIEKYKVVSVHRGDLLKIIPYPGTNPDKTSPNTGWFLVQKWCMDHGSGNGPIGFVPRIVCSIVRPDSTPRPTHVSPRHTRSHDYTGKMTDAATFMVNVSEVIQNAQGEQLSAASTICDTVSEPVPTRGVFPSPQLSLHTPSAAVAKTSFTSIPAVYEIEDRDSGRGPSSGSEWSSGKGGSLSGATDINIDDKDHSHPEAQPPSQTQTPANRSSSSSSLKWSPTGSYHRRASFDQTPGCNFSCPLPPPPMALLSHVRAEVLGGKESIPKSVPAFVAMSVSDTEAGGSICEISKTQTRLYVRGSRPSIADVDKKAGEGGERAGNSPASKEEADVKEKNDEESGISGSPQSTVVVVSSNSDPAHWEPYKTMIQVGQNKLEKFTLV